jgi:hypothetical protein
MSEQTEDIYDVFISYSHHDEEWVANTLLPRLEEARLRVGIDFRFVAGRPVLLNMQYAALNSRHTVLVLTPAWIASERTLFESLLIRTNDLAGLQRRAVPSPLLRSATISPPLPRPAGPVEPQRWQRRGAPALPGPRAASHTARGASAGGSRCTSAGRSPGCSGECTPAGAVAQEHLNCLYAQARGRCP